MNAIELKERLQSGGMVFGCMFSAIGTTRFKASLAGSTLDYVVIDSEHGSRDRKEIQELCLMLRDIDITPIVRVPVPMAENMQPKTVPPPCSRSFSSIAFTSPPAHCASSSGPHDSARRVARRRAEGRRAGTETPGGNRGVGPWSPLRRPRINRTASACVAAGRGRSQRSCR